MRASVKLPKEAPKWRYSLRWAMPHIPCPGPIEIASCEVLAGSTCPPEIRNEWKPGTGYAITIDFEPPKPIKRWSDERRAETRKRNLVKRVQKAAPLFADELIIRELNKRPEYFAGKQLSIEKDSP